MIQAVPNTRAKPLPSPANPATSREMAEQIRRLVRRNARRWQCLIALEALGLAVAAPLAYLWLVFAIDNLVHLPVWGRFLACLCLCAGIGWLGYSLVRRWRQVHLTEDQVALAMERQTPGGVENRLINALQIARDALPGQAPFGAAVVQENYQRLQQVTLRQAAQLRPALVRVAAALVLIAVGGYFWFAHPAHFSNAASRILLPFADIDPLYRTVLTVEPGNIEAMGDVPILVRIRGDKPAELVILRNAKGSRSSETVPVDPHNDMVSYTFKAVDQSMTYAVQGGDYTSPFYRIDVPTPARLGQVKVTYQYPAYTNLPERSLESTGGDLEALVGTRARVTFVFDKPADAATLLLERLPDRNVQDDQGDASPSSIPLNQVSPVEFSGEVLFQGVSAYQVETRQGERPPHRSSAYALRVLSDQEPRLLLSGLERQTEIALESVLPVKVSATDDYGLDRVGIFYRRANLKKEEWTPAIVWQAGSALTLQQTYELVVPSLGVTEGDRLEVALRALDTDPLKKDRWTTGTIHRFLIGGEGVALQLLYEQILQTESEIKAVIASQQQTMGKAAEWLRKLDGTSGLRWDDRANLEALVAAMKDQARDQQQVRETASKVARAMVPEAGNLRLSLGMLADTEMIRAIRIIDTVSSREGAQLKRSTLADARLTQERTIRSLQEILEQYIKFRQEWELAHLVPFTKLLADRQAGLHEESRKHAAQPEPRSAELWQNSASRRQTRLLELTQLAQSGFAGLAERLSTIDSILGRAFAEAATTMAADDLKTAMRQAAEQARAGHWSEAAQHQARAAETLAALHARLRKAQSEAALRALTALQEKAKSDAEAQQQIAKLKAGTSENFLDLKDKLKLEEIIHMQEQTQKKGGAEQERHVEDYLFPDSARGMLQQPDTGKRQEFDILKLAQTPGTTPSFPKQSDREANKVAPHIQEKFDDLVGKLLEEADEIQEKYETYNLNAAVNINEPGEIGKQAGDLNSTAAAAATGNQKPPTSNVGGASRAGRRGARAHGMVVGSESINRRGRDKVQEGQERVGDQDGSIREKKSGDMQKDTSTGVGGKKVESDEDTRFSVADAGKFTEDIARRMDKPQGKHSIVERQDGKLDPRIAEMMRDLDSKHEQLIERVKVLRKELKNLYLPTEHLDEILAELNANLGRLRDRPNPEVFRLQQQALDRLRGAVRVFHQAHAGFQPSVVREQVIQGRILDEPARQTYPGYEEAVKRYYQKLSER